MMPASPWIGSMQHRDRVVVDGGGHCVGVTERHGPESGCERAEAAARASSSSEKLTMLIVRPWKLLCATMILACPAGTPLTSVPHLRATLMPLSTASAPLFIGSTMSLPHSRPATAQNGPSRSEWNARLTSVTASSWRARRDDLGVAVAEVHRRVRGQAVQVAAALDVGDPRTLGAGGHHRQRRVVVRGVAIVDARWRRRRSWRHDRCPDGHEYTSSVQHLTDPPPLSSSERSTPMGSKPASYSCPAKPVAAAGARRAGRRTRR